MGKRKAVDEAMYPAVRETVVGNTSRKPASYMSKKQTVVIHCCCGKDYPVAAWAWQGCKVSYCKRCNRAHKFADYLKVSL